CNDATWVAFFLRGRLPSQPIVPAASPLAGVIPDWAGQAAPACREPQRADSCNSLDQAYDHFTTQQYLSKPKLSRISRANYSKTLGFILLQNESDIRHLA